MFVTSNKTAYISTSLHYRQIPQCCVYPEALNNHKHACTQSYTVTTCPSGTHISTLFLAHPSTHSVGKQKKTLKKNLLHIQPTYLQQLPAYARRANRAGPDQTATGWLSNPRRQCTLKANTPSCTRRAWCYVEMQAW